MAPKQRQPSIETPQEKTFRERTHNAVPFEDIEPAVVEERVPQIVSPEEVVEEVPVEKPKAKKSSKKSKKSVK
jgi:hypothetical protein